MAVLSALILLQLGVAVFAVFCKKELFYHREHSYGYDIYCNSLDNESMPELTQTMVYNEIKLTVEHSSFRNVSWRISAHLPKLREVNIRYCQLDSPSIFRGLRRLTLLHIQHNTFDRMNFGYFDDLEDLEELDLRNNSLTNSIFNDSSHLAILAVLNLNNNNLLGVFYAYNCTFYNLRQIYLQYNHIEELGNISCLNYVEEMYLDFNYISNMNHVNTLVNLRLLSLRNNNIEKLTTFHNLKKLEVLNLEGNKISILDVNDLSNLSKLRELILKDNSINIISDNFLGNMKNLRYLNLANNSIDQINSKCLSFIEKLALAHNRISSLTTFSDNIHLKYLDVSNNNIGNIEQYIFSKLSNLMSLNLSDNYIGNNIYDASFFGLISLQNLQLENISISYIPENVFVFSTKMQILNLSQNRMKMFGKLLDKLVNLQTLNVSYNLLDELRYDTIKNMLNLELIDVESNFLRNIEYEPIVMYLHKLMTINIKNNTLSCDFLTKMIKFFTYNHVNYTINEDFHYDQENVAGIYCKETKNRQNDLEQENAVILKHLVNSTKTNTNEYNNTFMRSATYATLSVVLISIFLTFVFYRLYVYMKRRYYCSDEFELIEDKY